MTSTNRLIELYEDKDGQRKAEVASLTGPNEFNEFYIRLKQIKDFYRKHPNEVCSNVSNNYFMYLYKLLNIRLVFQCLLNLMN